MYVAYNYNYYWPA